MRVSDGCFSSRSGDWGPWLNLSSLRFILNSICKSHPESKYQVEDSIAETQEEWGHG